MKIGFAGLGDMGSLIVPRLIAAGHDVNGWNRTKAKATALAAEGMKVADTPADAARDADVMFSILTDGPAVTEVALGPSGISSSLRKSALYIDMSTISPVVSRKVAEAFKEAGLCMLDAPISGSPITVRAGQASMMVGGSAEDFERAKPVLLAIGPKVLHIGDNGLACQMKIAVNLLLMVEVVCFGEAMALAEKGGVKREVALSAILNSVAASPVLGYRGPFILEGKMPDKPLADVTLQQKDMQLALELGRTLGSPVPLAAAANEMMNACRGLGIDHRDFVAAHEVYLRLGGQLK
jgi:3-hydroxyisobutyrate dehydrogenase-like beta-hydroxyacid dehydrogenase